LTCGFAGCQGYGDKLDSGILAPDCGPAIELLTPSEVPFGWRSSIEATISSFAESSIVRLSGEDDELRFRTSLLEQDVEVEHGFNPSAKACFSRLHSEASIEVYGLEHGWSEVFGGETSLVPSNCGTPDTFCHLANIDASDIHPVNFPSDAQARSRVSELHINVVGRLDTGEMLSATVSLWSDSGEMVTEGSVEHR